MTRRAATVVVLLVAVTAVAIGGAAGTSPASSGSADRERADTLVQPGANNTTVHHDNPETVGESGSDSTRAWLEAELSERFGESSIQVSQGRYEQARELVDNDTKELLGKYVDVAGDTEEGNEKAEQFRETQENQQEFVNQTQEYQETYREYQEARRNGNERRARALARELDRIEENATESGRDLSRNLETVSNSTGADLRDAETAVNETVRNISSRQAEVREATFTNTTLVANARAETFSFRDPLPITGRLVDENGTAIANRTITLQVGGSAHTVETGSNGTYSFVYRPVVLPVDAERVRVHYRPSDASPYLGSTTNVTASVDGSTTPQISVTVNPTSTRFGDDLSVTGTVEAEGIGVRSLPLVVTLGNERLGVVRTGEDGRFVFNGTVPARVPPGETTVSTRVAVRNRAIARTDGTTTLEILTTPTNLTVSATPVDEMIRVNGRLTTADGRPLANKIVRVSVAGVRMRAVDTDTEGRFRMVLPVPDDVTRAERSRVNVTADVTWEGRNIEAAQARTTVQLSRSQGIGIPGLRDVQRFVAKNPAAAAGIAAVVGVVLLGAGWIVRRRETPVPVAPQDGEPADDATASTSSTDQATSLLSQARDRLQEDPQSAIRLGYAAVRERFGADTAATHWEFYGNVREDLGDVEPLRELTETYERAVFGYGVDRDEAEDAVESATALTRGEPSPDGGRPDED